MPEERQIFRLTVFPPTQHLIEPWGRGTLRDLAEGGAGGLDVTAAAGAVIAGAYEGLGGKAGGVG